MKLRGNVFGGMTNLETIDAHFSKCAVLEDDTAIKALLLVNEHGIFGENAYKEFLVEISGKDVPVERVEYILDFDKWIFRAREIRILQRLITRLLDFRKLTIIGLQGTIVTPFFGLSLAADFRFATEDMAFSLSHVKYRLQPTGALPFFLPRFLGQGKTTELLLRGGEISAQEALELGLITAILPKKDFEELCIERAKHLCQQADWRVIETTKHLLYYFRSELREYFEKEADFVEVKNSMA